MGGWNQGAVRPVLEWIWRSAANGGDWFMAVVTGNQGKLGAGLQKISYLVAIQWNKVDGMKITYWRRRTKIKEAWIRSKGPRTQPLSQAKEKTPFALNIRNGLASKRLHHYRSKHKALGLNPAFHKHNGQD